jgi:hypothetical protein
MESLSWEMGQYVPRFHQLMSNEIAWVVISAHFRTVHKASRSWAPSCLKVCLNTRTVASTLVDSCLCGYIHGHSTQNLHPRTFISVCEVANLSAWFQNGRYKTETKWEIDARWNQKRRNPLETFTTLVKARSNPSLQTTNKACSPHSTYKVHHHLNR